ncbi:hypothetical protein C8J56DRAFT_1043199 [Mycena floridula]|nr:hypothetical protein C8J56DRAFT_1043199 [Mycena floridula]
MPGLACCAQAGRNVLKQTGKGYIDPNTIRDQFQNFGRIVKINSGQYHGSAVTFFSPEDAKKLLDTATADGEVTTAGQIFRVRPLTLQPQPLSTALVVTVFKKVQDTDIHKAFSTFGSIKKVSKWKESLAVVKLSYMAHFNVQFDNIEDAVKANWTLVSLDGTLMQTRMGLSTERKPNRVLLFAIEPPWDHIQPDYTHERFVGDLSRRANVPLEELEYMRKFDPNTSIEAAQKIKAIPSSEMHNAKFSVRFYRRVKTARK